MKQLTRQPSKWGMAAKSIGAILPAGALALGLVFSFNAGAVEPSTVVVTEADPQGWSTADTRTGGDVNFIEDATSPFPTGALQLTTDGTNEAKAQYMHEENTPLAEVTELSYSTKQVSGPAHADASYQLAVFLDGTEGSFTTFVYEPYQQTDAVITDEWQTWDVASGQFWSSRTVTDGADCNVTAGAGGAPFYTLSQLQEDCPEAVVVGFGVNVGTYNPGYDVEVDGVNFNGTTYDFETQAPVTTPVSAETKEQCMSGGWMVFETDENVKTYKNQGQCVADVSSSSNSRMHREE